MHDDRDCQFGRRLPKRVQHWVVEVSMISERLGPDHRTGHSCVDGFPKYFGRQLTVL